jgi:hypothetical protein
VRDDCDVAVAVDTLEGRAPDAREALIESASQARSAVLIAGRFADDGALPALAPMVARLEGLGFAVALTSNGHTPWVVPLTELWRRSQERPGVLKASVAPLLADANRRLAPLDFLEPALRRIVVAVRGVRLPPLPSPTVEDYREAARRSAELWAAAAPLLDGAVPETAGA